MLRFLARIGAVVAMLTALLMLVRTVGGASPNPLAAMFTSMILPDGYKQYCWHGICPGQMALDEARRILDADTTLTKLNPDQPSCWKSHPPFYVVCLNPLTVGKDKSFNIDLGLAYTFYDDVDPTTLMRFWLGDAITLWGQPVGMNATDCLYRSHLFFKGHISVDALWVKVSGHYEIVTLDPGLSEVYAITLAAPPSSAQDEYVGDQTWTGFARQSFSGCMGGE